VLVAVNTLWCEAKEELEEQRAKAGVSRDCHMTFGVDSEPFDRIVFN